MQVSLKWVNELVNIETINLENIIEKITLGGFEVEDIITIETNKQKQLVLDISATANRSDSLSIQGISSEISILLDQSLKIPIYSEKIIKWKDKIKVLLSSTSTENDYSMFITLKIENVTNTKSPEWLKQKLINSGITPNNNILDFKNYILLETGYPFEFYDYHKIVSKTNDSNFSLSIGPAKEDEEFLTSNNNSYKLDKSVLVVKANKVSISIAGIIESKDVSYSDETTSLLIEGSIFNASKVRQQSRILGIRTDRSTRYEKSLKSTYLIESFYRLISLLRISNPNITCHFNTGFKINEKPNNPILLRYRVINEILGPIKSFNKSNINYLSPKLITVYLKRLNFDYSYNDLKLNWKVNVTDLRNNDVTREIDLIEEIGRLHGFNNFLVALPKIKTIGKKDLSYQTRKKITQCFLNLGLNELIHYSLVDGKILSNSQIKLINPLISDYSNLRLNLLPDLVKTLKENIKQGNLLLEGFEYGHIFFENNSKVFEEKEYVAGVFGGNRTKLSWSETERSLNWFEAKGKIEQFLQQLNIRVVWKKNVSTNLSKLIHPYRSSEICSIKGEKMGIFGQIHPAISKKLDISFEIYLFEFDIKIIQNEIKKNKILAYKEYFAYPKIFKDLSFIIDTSVTFEELKTVLYYNGTQFLSEIKLLDEYKGKSIPDNNKSLCLQLVFQSNTKTLENKDIEIILKNLSRVLTKKFGAQIRE